MSVGMVCRTAEEVKRKHNLPTGRLFSLTLEQHVILLILEAAESRSTTADSHHWGLLPPIGMTRERLPMFTGGNGIPAARRVAMMRSSHSPHIHRLWIRLLWLLIIAVLLAIVLFPRSTSPSGLICGDINRDGRITAADLIWMVNYIFKGGLLPDPEEVADVNADSVVNLADVVYLVSYVYKNGNEPTCPPFGLPVVTSGCKTFVTGVDSSSSQDCIEWEYDGAGQLHVRHINAGFNCCPDEIVVNAYVDTGAVFIEEQEYFGVSGGCSCLCLFDLEFTVTNVYPGTYVIHVLELYLIEGDDPLAAIITLDPTPASGSFCVDRAHYPWGL